MLGGHGRVPVGAIVACDGAYGKWMRACQDGRENMQPFWVAYHEKATSTDRISWYMTMASRMVVRTIRRVMGFRRRMMVQEGMLGLLRQRPADSLRQQRAEQHAADAGEQAGELRRH